MGSTLQSTRSVLLKAQHDARMMMRLDSAFLFFSELAMVRICQKDNGQKDNGVAGRYSLNVT